MIENKIQTEVKKSRRGLPRHTKNPFLNDTNLHTKTGIRRITTGKDRLALRDPLIISPKRNHV